MGKKIDISVDFFNVLGVKASSSDEEVKKAYKALAKQWHPDKNRDDGAEEKFKIISAAYEALKSADERSIYRREREQALNEAEREKKRKKRQENFHFYQPSNSDSKFKSSFFFQTGPDGKNKKNSEDSWRYHGREDSPFSGPYGYKSKPEEHKNKKNSKHRKPWSQNWNEKEDDFKPFGFEWDTFSRSNFSSAFNAFVDDLFHFNSFFSGTDPFEDFFFKKKYEKIFEPSSEKKQQAPKNKGYTYYATFGDGPSARKYQNEESENKPQNGRRRDSPPGFSFDDYPDDDAEEEHECVCCGKKFAIRDEMVRHEVICKDVNGRANGTQRMNRPLFGKPTGDWRSTHENLVKNIRNMRRSSSNSRVDDDEETEPTSRPETEYIKCHICGRTFNKPAMEHHTVYCQMRYKANCGEPDEVFFTKEQYPKTMPHPGSGIPPSGRSQQNNQGSESPRTSRTSTPGKYSSRTCFPDLGSRRTMDDPFTFTRTGLHSQRVPTQSSSSRQPRVYEFRFSSKGGNGIGGLSGGGTGFEDRKHLTRNQCPNCRSVYARNARYCISCGFKRPG